MSEARSAPQPLQGLPEGIAFHPAFLSDHEQRALLEDVRAVVASAPLFVPEMPKTGRPMHVRMTNCGPLGWVTDKEHGYRYQATHPVTGNAWPDMPRHLLSIWTAVSNCALQPQACLVNYYDAEAKMGLHQDRDEKDFSAPVVSISLGDDCLFRIGGTARKGPTRSVRLRSGDVIVLGGAARLCYHGVDRIYPGTSTLLKKDGRINLTLRHVDGNRHA